MEPQISTKEFTQYLISNLHPRKIYLLHSSLAYPTVFVDRDDGISIHIIRKSHIRINPGTLRRLGAPPGEYFIGRNSIKWAITFLYSKGFTTLDLFTIWRILLSRSLKRNEANQIIWDAFQYRLQRLTYTPPILYFRELYLDSLNEDINRIRKDI